MKHVKSGLSYARKVTALLLVLVMVLTLPVPVMVHAVDDALNGTIRVYPWRYGEDEGLSGIAYEFSSITDMRIVRNLEETRELPGAISMFMPWDMSVDPPVRGDWDYDFFQRHLGGQLTVLYVDTHTPVIFTVHLPHDFPLYDNEDASTLWRFGGSLDGRLDGGEFVTYRALEEGVEYHPSWLDFPMQWNRYELERRVTFDAPGVFRLDDFHSPAIFIVARDGVTTDPSREPERQDDTTTTAPNLNTASSWAHDGINSAYAHGLIPQVLQSNYTQATTRAEFAALAVALYETVTGREITERAQFNDTTDVNVQKMGGLGIVTGIGGGYFAPDRTITRQEAAALLARLAYAIGQPLPASAPTFADNAGIASWAVNRVGQVQAAGIMTGVGNNNFAPNGTYTREQSIVSMLRLFELLD